MMTVELILEGKPVQLVEPVFGRVKRAIVAYNAITRAMSASSSPLEGDVLDRVTDLLAIALDKTTDEVESMSITPQEALAAPSKIADWAGLKFEQAKPGESRGVDSTNSTSTS